jgi:hypothetical protein
MLKYSFLGRFYAGESIARIPEASKYFLDARHRFSAPETSIFNIKTKKS